MSSAIIAKGAQSLMPYAKQAAVIAGKKLLQSELADLMIGAGKKAMRKKNKVQKTIAKFADPSPASTSLNHYAGAPVSVGVRVKSVRPKYKSTSGSVIISHRERVTDVYNNNGSGVGVYRVNPFNPYLWPWLAGSSDGYNKYRVLKCSFEYVPACSTSQTGRVTLAWCADASDTAPLFNELMNYEAISGAPWMPNMLTIPPSVEKYIGDQAGTSTTANTMYCHGDFFIGTRGVDTNNLGELYVDYTVQLLEPQPVTGYSSVVDITRTSGEVFFNTVTGRDGYVPAVVAKSTGLALIIPAGVFHLEWYQKGTVVAAAPFGVGGGAAYSTTSNINLENAGATEKITVLSVSSDGTGYVYPNAADTFTTNTISQIRITKVSSQSFTNTTIYL
jgi:hypothetical protein